MRIRIALLLAPALAALCCLTAPAGAAPLGEIDYLPTQLSAFGIAAGPEGDVWVAGGESIAKIATGGSATVLTLLNTSELPAGRIVTGSEGDMWYSKAGIGGEIGRITPSGEIATFDSEAKHAARWMTLGPEGAVWFTAGVIGLKKVGEEYESSAIGRITPAGQATEFTAGLSAKSLLGQITAGPDGDLWFVNDGNPYAIGRLTPSGEIKEFTIPKKGWLKPSGITAGADGNVFFGASGENEGEETESVIAEITPAGETKIVKRLDNSEVTQLATGPEGGLWFAGRSTELGQPNVIGRLGPEGKLEEDLANLGTETEATLISPAADGSMWFATVDKSVRRVGSIGTGAPPASQTPPTVSGPDQVGGTLSCDGASWSSWAGQQPSTGAYAFDGYTWTLDGQPIAGQSAQTLPVSAADAGQQVACTATATYRLLDVSVNATSAPVSIAAAPSPSPPPPAKPTPSALALGHQTDRVTGHGALHVTLDCSGAPCSGTVELIYKTKVTTGKGKHRRTKTKSVTIATAAFSSLALGADKVSLKLTRQGLGLLEHDGYRLGASAHVSYTTSGAAKATVAGAVTLVGTKPKPKRHAG
jgi:hypothetical protein